MFYRTGEWVYGWRVSLESLLLDQRHIHFSHVGEQTQIVNYRDLETTQLLNFLNLTTWRRFGGSFCWMAFPSHCSWQEFMWSPRDNHKGRGSMDKPAAKLHWPNNDSKITLHLAINQHTKHELLVCYWTKFMKGELFIYQTSNNYTNTWQ
jgi:hypothetical protein